MIMYCNKKSFVYLFWAKREYVVPFFFWQRNFCVYSNPPPSSCTLSLIWYKMEQLFSDLFTLLSTSYAFWNKTLSRLHNAPMSKLCKRFSSFERGQFSNSTSGYKNQIENLTCNSFRVNICVEYTERQSRLVLYIFYICVRMNRSLTFTKNELWV